MANILVEELKEKAPSLYQRLFVERNVRWSEEITRILDGAGVHFIAVCAAHLVGPDSIQAQLAKRDQG